jgi:hypothetical protein
MFFLCGLGLEIGDIAFKQLAMKSAWTELHQGNFSTSRQDYPLAESLPKYGFSAYLWTTPCGLATP